MYARLQTHIHKQLGNILKQYYECTVSLNPVWTELSSAEGTQSKKDKPRFPSHISAVREYPG